MNPYVNPRTGILFNKFWIMDRHELRIAEYDATGLPLTQLRGPGLLTTP